jgi:antitoxin component YwqK of YwqJK toxin-antitoxin module
VQLNEYYENGLVMYKSYYRDGILRKTEHFDPAGDLLKVENY